MAYLVVRFASFPLQKISYIACSPCLNVYRKATTIASAMYVGYSILQAVTLAPLVDAIQEQLKLLPPDELKRILREAQAESTGLVIPLPWTLSYIDPEPYDPHGPEWTEMMRLSRDKTLVKSIYGAQNTP